MSTEIVISNGSPISATSLIIGESLGSQEIQSTTYTLTISPSIPTAGALYFDNSDTGLSATTIQGAIEEVYELNETYNTEINETVSTLESTVQDKLDLKANADEYLSLDAAGTSSTEDVVTGEHDQTIGHVVTVGTSGILSASTRVGDVNLDTLLTTDTYFIDAANDSVTGSLPPVFGQKFILKVVAGSTTTSNSTLGSRVVKQEAIDSQYNLTYVRTYSGTWAGWELVIQSGNLANTTEVMALSADLEDIGTELDDLALSSTNASNLTSGTISDARLPSTISSDITGNAATATKLTTARTITLSGDVSGSTTFDGSANKSISVTVVDNSHNHTTSTISDFTTAVDARIQNIVGAAPEALDTLEEIAAQLEDDQDAVASLTAVVATKLPTASYTASDVLTKIKTVDGSGSGLDADLWDGNQFASYLNQVLRTDSAPTFTSMTISSNISVTGKMSSGNIQLNHNEIPAVTGSVSNITSNLIQVGGDAYNVDTTSVYLPLLGGSTRHSGGYVTHYSLGIKKDHQDWGYGDTGFFLALGTTDTNPTEEYRFTTGGTIFHSSGTLNTTGNLTVSGTATASGGFIGNASTATKLATARTITVGNKSNSFDGSSNITFSQSDIGYTASDVLTKLKTVDGAGSGLDADLLDGLNSGSFVRSDEADIKTSGALTFNDNIYLNLGTGGDVEHYWNGSHYYTDVNGGGNWYVRDGNSSNANRFIFDVDNGTLEATGGFIGNFSGYDIGQVSPFARTSAPSGWLKANGAAVSRTTYADLYAALGTTFGSGDGSTTFNLPDLRGEFVRGWDDSRGIDSGRVFGSSQLDQMQRITGEFRVHGDGDATSKYIGTMSDVSINSTGNTWGSGSGDTDTIRFNSANSPDARVSDDTTGETRPRNVALLYCIKY
jgi:microcystin-dependent protein